MSKISSPWHDRLPRYCKISIKNGRKIMPRTDNRISVGYIGDVYDKLLEVDKISDTEFIFRGEIKLRDILYRLQYFAHFNANACTITMNILGEDTKFKLEESKWTNNQRGWQILVYNADGYRPRYKDIMESLNTLESNKLANAILTALGTPLDNQEMFELKGYHESDVGNVRMFILLTHIAEAAVPSVKALKQYLSIVDSPYEMTEIKDKHGRTPMMDKIVRAKLRNITDDITNDATFSSEFSEEAFPSQVEGGTQMSRERALKGNETNSLSDIEDESDGICQTEVETNPSGEIQDLTDPLSDIKGATGTSNDTDDLANSLRRMNVTAAKNN